MGFLTNPTIDQRSTDNQVSQDVQGAISPFLQNLFRGGENPLTNDLTGQAGEALSTFIGQTGPEQQTFQNLEQGLLSIFGGGGAGSFGDAASEVSQRNLQASLGQLSNVAPGRFSSAFAGQGIGLAQRAQQDLNLLQQQFGQQDIANRLGAGSLLGTLSGQAGNADFNRILQAGEFGQGQQQQLLELLLGGLGFARPQPLDTIVGDSPLSQIGDIGVSAITAKGLL